MQSWMRRGRKKDSSNYIKIRIDQLLEDRKKEIDSLNRELLWRFMRYLKKVANIIDLQRQC